MLFKGETIQVSLNANNIIHLKFDSSVDKINKFNAQTLKELAAAYQVIAKQKEVRGLILLSGKEHFIMGADVTEFLTHFKNSEEQLALWLQEVNKTFNGFSDLPYPTVTAINGFSLGGGFEISLTTTYRVATQTSQVGLPETKLGIFPGWGGTVRLPRLVGADNAIEWITSGKQYSAADALKIRAVDAVVSDESKLISAATSIIERAHKGDLDWRARKDDLVKPLKLNKIESMMCFETAKGFVLGVAGPNYPAPIKAIEVIQKGATLNRDEALIIEGKTFASVAKSKTAESLVRVFLGDQYLKKESKIQSAKAKNVTTAAVLGAGIMGGGIAYQSASTGTPIIMKDINEPALKLGMGEANKLLSKLVAIKKIDVEKMGTVISSIKPTLSYSDFASANVVIEAVVENEKVKKQVLKDVENVVDKNTIIASNTSTISITKLAEGLSRPENFCGMHFFNPVHKMPLVEIIRGKKSSDEAIATMVAYANKMGKKPIVVGDCPGFLVNRILFPYFGGFAALVNEGVDFVRIDKIMEKFGWPMGPAYLLDVVGIDTAFHAASIMAEGFPDRMTYSYESSMEKMYKEKRFGQKNSKGYYQYSIDKKGKPKKDSDPAVTTLLYSNVKAKDVSDEEIIERMMFPMIFEAARCLSDKIVNSPIEVDMGLLLGLGFPPFRTGALKYADDFGLNKIVSNTKKYEYLGKLYTPPENLISLANKNETFYK